MRRVRGITIATALAAALALAASAAGARGSGAPFVETVHFSWASEDTEIGCHEEVVISASGDAVVHVTHGDGWFHLAGAFTGTASWQEDTDGDATTPDELLVGRSAAPLSGHVLPSGGEVFTELFTGTLKGDRGTHGVFRARFHVTLTPQGELVVAFERLAGECR